MKTRIEDPRVWLSGKDAGLYIGRSRDAVEKRAVPWQDDYVPKKIRYKLLQMDEGGEAERRYFKFDFDHWLVVPPGGTTAERSSQVYTDATNRSGNKVSHAGERTGDAISSQFEERTPSGKSINQERQRPHGQQRPQPPKLKQSGDSSGERTSQKVKETALNKAGTKRTSTTSRGSPLRPKKPSITWENAVKHKINTLRNTTKTMKTRAIRVIVLVSPRYVWN